MAENQNVNSNTFLALKAQIDEELSRLSSNLERIPETDFSNATYIRYSKQMDYIQGLFDKASSYVKDLSLDQNNPDFYALLQAKTDLDSSYGLFNRTRSGFFGRFSKQREGREDERLRDFLGLNREAQDPGLEAEDDFKDEFSEDEELLLIEEEEDSLAKESKKKSRAERQKRFSEAGRERDRRNAEQRAREQEAARLGIHRDDGRIYSEADLQRERIRQEDARAEAEQARIDRLRQEREVFEAYRQRMMRAENFERLDKSHIDLSPNISPETDLHNEQNTSSSDSGFSYNSEAKPTESKSDAQNELNSPQASYEEVKIPPSYEKPYEAEAQRAPVYESIPYEEKTAPESFKKTEEIHVFSEQEVSNSEESVAYASEVNKEYNDAVVSGKEREYQQIDTIPYEPVSKVVPDIHPAETHADPPFESQKLYSDFHRNVPVYAPTYEVLTQNHYECPVSYAEHTDKGFLPYQFVPGGIEVASEEHSAFSKVKSNEKIYSSLASNYIDGNKEPLVISPVFEEQMRFNMEKAEQHYNDVKGTLDEADAARNCFVQRQAYNSFRNDITQGKIRFSAVEADVGTEHVVKDFVPYQFTTPELAVLSDGNNAVRKVNSNEKIYSFLSSNNIVGKSEPLTVSPVYETQMRFNMENARLHYHDVKGTSAEADATHKYFEERQAYNSFRNDIKQGRIKISMPEVITVDEKPSRIPLSSLSSGNNIVYSYMPGGIVATTAENGQLTNNKAFFENPGVRSNRVISPKDPLIVSPEYEAAITSNMQKAVGILNQMLSDGKTAQHISSDTAVNLKLYTDAYLGFQRAKRNGSVVISSDASINTPDYKAWQARKNAGAVLGTTAQAKGANPNKVSRAEVEETVANIFGSSSKLKQESLAKAYVKQIGTRIADYGTAATYMASRRLYRMIQDGDDNALRTMENGRYYISTVAGVALAIHDRNVIKAELSGGLHGSNVEFNRYGTTSFLSDKQLSREVNNGLRLGRERKAEIKAVSSQLKEVESKVIALQAEMNARGDTASAQLNRTVKQRDALASKLEDLKASHKASNKELSKAISLKNFRQQDKIHDELVKELTKNGKPPQNLKEMDRFIQDFRAKNHQQIEKKFGKLAKNTSASLTKEIDRLKTQAKSLKGQIKLLQSKGSALSQADRKLLKELMDQHKELNLTLRKHIGLKQARDIFDLKLEELGKYRKRFAKGKQRMSNGLYGLQNFMLRPLFEGGEFGTRGLARFAQISSNHYVHVLVKQSFKGSIFIGKTAMNAVVPGSAEALTTNLHLVKRGVETSVKLGAKTVKTAVKTGVKTAAKATGRSIVNFTPTRIKTAARAGVSKLRVAKSKYDTVAAGIRNSVFKAKSWLANTRVGRGLAALNRGSASLVKGIKLVGGFVKTAAIKVTAICFGVLFLISFIATVATALFGSSASSVILSPEEKNGKIDLGPYVALISDREAAFMADINAMRNDPEYENVTVNYTTGVESNMREMLSMMAVRMGQDLDLHSNSKIEAYLDSLFYDSHFYTTSVFEYLCSGCEVRELEEINVNDDGTVSIRIIEEEYCPGHKDLEIDITVLGFDQIFTVDSMGNAGQDVVAGEFIGSFKLTYYCTEKYPHICNAGPPYETATGTTPTPGRTIAVDPSIIPLGTHVIINGHEYIAEDTGGAIKEKRIDVVVATHREALAMGTKNNVNVYLAGYEGESMVETGIWDGWTDENITWCKAIYNTDWNELYTGVPNINAYAGAQTDLSGVKFIDGERPGYDAIVNIALAQAGNHGGQKFWSWYGYQGRVAWCAIFVSWCANEAGYLDSAIPRFAYCPYGRQAFIEMGQWARPGDITPVAGDVIFFDWEGDSVSDHVGYVIGTDGTYVYTVEGNTGDQVAVRHYGLYDSCIMGYGLPNY